MSSQAQPRRFEIHIDREVTHPQGLDLLREHSAGGHGELKSMRTNARHLRQGAAQTILTALLNLAR